MTRHPIALIVELALAGTYFLSAASNDAVKVDGGLIAGAVENGVRSYKGIPFAQPPVGDLRWKAPQPVVAWQGVRKADAFPSQCMQMPYPAGSPYSTADVPKGEDCLYLNVWTTAGANQRRPVMVWIHGGG